MKLQFILYCFITISACNLQANLIVTMPNQAVLRDRLYQKGYGHFAASTTIIEQLANKKFSPLALCNKIGLTSFYYAYHLCEGEMVNENAFLAIKDYYVDLIYILFNGHPHAMAEVKERGIIDRIRAL